MLSKPNRGADSRRIHWFCWQPTPYNDFLFRRIAQEVPLVVHFRERVLPSHPWKTPLGEGYPAGFYRKRFGLDWSVIGLPFQDPSSLYVVAGWDHPTAWVLLSLLRLLQRRYAIWTDTPHLAATRHPFKAAARKAALRWWFQGALALMGTGRPGLRALEEMGAPVDKLIDFPFWVDLDAYRPGRELHGTDGPVQLLSVGRVDNSVKGHDIAIRALAQVRRECPALKWRYEIAGSGPDIGRLQALVKSLGLEDRVHFLGWVEPQDLILAYQRSHVLLHPSPVHDPFPNAILEGMAAGLCVFASDACGAALDRIEHGVNGFLHRAGDADELAAQLPSVLREPGKLIEVGRRARATAEEWPVERGLATIKRLLASCAES
ncbi:glycosyltransferase family 4 protein [Nitrospira calida]|jgi:glycosyltransferase involved in cell wall biosynthesis